MDQFVATFHRFCGDDQTFFVATMTSRPVGLETAFSIQLADKQPVLRGLCVVLDAWATPDNRYQRPGIRLGIKRLTPDSQVVFDRLRAASKAPGAIADATPAPGSPPNPPLSATGQVPRPPSFSLRAATDPPALPVRLSPEPPAPLPRLNTPPAGLPSTRARTGTATPPALPRLPARPAPPPPAAAAPPHEQPPAPPPPAAAAEANLATGPSQPGPPPAPGPAPQPAPVAVTRFQVALRVGTIPPPVSDLEFKPTQLLSRLRSEPKPIGEATPGEHPIAPRTAPPPDPPPNVPGAEPAARAPDPEPAADLRTPGSALVLPANPLHNLSDESLEGFVDCTLYEETGNIFHPAIDGGDWNDEVVEPPAARPASVTPPAAVPAMPYDAPPDLTVRARGNTESLAIAPDAPPAAEPQDAHRSYTLTPTAALFAPLHDGRATSASPWLEAAGAMYGTGLEPQAPASAPGLAPVDPAAAMPVQDHTAAVYPLPVYHAVDATRYAHGSAPPPAAVPDVLPDAFSATLPVSLPGFSPVHAVAAWKRGLLIAGTVAVAIVIAFVIAKQVRGPDRVVPAAAGSGVAAVGQAPGPAPVTGQAPPPAPVTRQAPRPAPVTGQAPPPAPAVTAQQPAGSADPTAEPPAPEDDGAAAPGGTPVVGSGPCRLTVATTPAGSIIRFDDQPMGPSPITIDGTCDKHKIDATHARYQSLTRRLTLAAGKPQQLDLDLPRPIHAVTVVSLPPGAELSIDGHRAGTTPAVVQMMGFATVNLTFTKAGFRTLTKKVYSKVPRDRVFVKLVR